MNFIKKVRYEHKLRAAGTRELETNVPSVCRQWPTHAIADKLQIALEPCCKLLPTENPAGETASVVNGRQRIAFIFRGSAPAAGGPGVPVCVQRVEVDFSHSAGSGVLVTLARIP